MKCFSSLFNQYPFDRLMNNQYNTRRLLICSIAAILAIGLTSPALAAENTNVVDGGTAATQEAVPTDDVWTLIEFDAQGVPPVGGPGSPYEFDCGGASCWFSVTDAALEFDWFEVFDGATSLGTTPVPTFGFSFCDDPDVCFADPNFSSGMFCLGPGTHEITIHDLTAAGIPSGQTSEVYPASVFFKVELHRDAECGPVGGAFSPVDNTALLIAYWSLVCKNYLIL